MDEAKEIRFIDLFGGIGGFRLGLEKANKIGVVPEQGAGDKEGRCEPLPEGSGEGGEFHCVWYCDNDKHAVSIYNKNFKEHWKPTDITEIKTENIPDFDLLCAGFPCQSFSVAGKRKGFQDTRGTLFFEICRIASAKKPRMLFLENVKGLLSHDGGRTFATILVSLDELGYDVEWQVLNSKDFGVPQNRERVFIVGHLREAGTKEIFPIGSGSELLEKKNNREQKKEKKLCSAIDSRYGSLRNAGETYIMEHKKITERSGEYGTGFKKKESFYLDSGCGRDLIVSRPHGFNKGLVKRYPNMRFSSIQNELVVKTHGIADAYRVYDPGGVGRTLKSSVGGVGAKTGLYSMRDSIRRLTPVECERLQGFPDNWTWGASDTQRYKCLGNAVSVPVITEMGKKILEVL